MLYYTHKPIPEKSLPDKTCTKEVCSTVKKETIIKIVVIAVVVILALSLVGTYNGLAMGRESVDTAHAEIDTVLQRRMDLIPNLVATVNALSDHELEVVNSVTDARAAMAGAATTEEALAASEELTRAVNNLLVVVENYPEITADSGYIGLMDELSGTENRIANARRKYNEAVQDYNKKVISFPGNLMANLFGFEKAPYYEASAGADTAPNVGDLFD